MKTEEVIYAAGSVQSKGFLVAEEGQGKLPAVIIAHAWRGLDDFSRNKAQELAKLGYVGFSADLYGNGDQAENDNQAASYMKPLFIDRKELRKRIVAAYDTIKKHPLVDSNRIAAIGFCFGGLTVIELLRSGQNVRGVVSLHGVLGDNIQGMQAKTEPIVKPINGSLLILHGYKDPLVSQQDLINIQKEFSEAQVDWQLDIYGEAAHAFTNPHATDQEHGLIYSERTCKRAWASTINFLREIF